MKDRLQQYSLLLLAGGKSSRMGQDKGNLLFEGHTFVDTLLKKGEQLGIRKFYLSGHGCDNPDVQRVEDIYKDCGPLGGLHACMKKIETPYCLVLAVDVPQIPVSVLTNLIQAHSCLMETNPEVKAFILKNGDREESLIGIYSVELAERMEENILAEKYSVFRFLNEIGYRTWDIEMDPCLVDNINTPQAYERLLEMQVTMLF